MSYYNGKYTQHLQIVIEAEDHDTCLRFTKYLRNAIKPWFFQLEMLSEFKSARKGDVLTREIQVRQTAYASDIITLNQMIKSLIWHYNLLYNVNIFIHTDEALPKDGRFDLLH